MTGSIAACIVVNYESILKALKCGPNCEDHVFILLNLDKRLLF